MAKVSSSGAAGMVGRLRLIGAVLIAVFLFLLISLRAGGHVPGLTYISPGNVGLVIDTYHGNVERAPMLAGTHWQGLWENVIEVPTAQRTLTLTASTNDDGADNAVEVNTMSNILHIDVSAQYHILPDRAGDLYRSYQDQFADIRGFEVVQLEPALKGAMNYAIGDMDTATALTTVGKQKAEQSCLQLLNDEWQSKGIIFDNVMIRGIEQDQESKDLLATTLQKMQDIDNAKLALQQQQFDNQTMVQQATADASVNRLQNSSLTDLYVQDQLLGRVKRVYLPTDEVLGTTHP